MNLKKWSVAAQDKKIEGLGERLGSLPPLTSLLLRIRGYDNEHDAMEFLEPDLECISVPVEFQDMDKAVERVQLAIDSGERIAVYGDYDADGVTATAMMVSYLDSIGGDVQYYIPDREEGYGLNCPAIQSLADDGVTLIITVDNGISAIEEVAFAKTLGVDVVITDHHRPRDILPDAVAVVDPHRKDCDSWFKELAGVGVAFQLIAAMEGEYCEYDMLYCNYGDLAGIGTIGDVVSLTCDNRMMVQACLSYMVNSDRMGLRALMERSGISIDNVTSSDVTYGIVPRINATGRMGSAYHAVELLLTEDLEEAERLADEICRNNDLRKEVENNILEQANALLAAEPDRLNDRVLVVEGEDFHHGVIGIVASRLLEQYGKPVIVISCTGDEAKGSGRSVEGFSLFDAIHKNGDLFTKYGGHPMAAGFTMKRENVGAFRRAMQEYAASLEEIPAQTVYLDCELQLSELSLDIPRELLRMEPFGCDNPQPTFGLFGVTLEEMMAVGEGKHMRLTLQKDGITVTAMLFNTPWDRFPYQKGDKLDAAVQLFAKTFRGQEQLSVVVRDIRISGLDENQMIADYALYERYKRRETLTAAQAERLLPTRDDFAKVYRLLRKTKTWDGNVQRLLKKVGGDMPLCRLLVILQAMHQCRLIRVRAFGDRMRLSVLQVAGKVEIATAPIILEIHRLTKGEGTNA